MNARTLAAVAFCLVAAGATDTPAQSSAARKGITDVQGIRVGHHTLSDRPTGCTVILADGQGAVGGVSQRGGAPGTVETNLLDPSNLVERVNAVFLSGGSAFGLDVKTGVSRYLEERRTGYAVGAAGVVPIVTGAILFDLGFGGDSKIRPGADCGYRAATAATDGPVQEGNIGAGAGATVGKMGGRGRRPMKAGVGSASIVLESGLIVGAVVAVNAVGDIVDPMTGRVVAGTRNSDGTLADARRVLREAQAPSIPGPLQNTTIAIVATNARLTKAQAHRMAIMADDGLARAIVPSHTMSDGDTVFALATGRYEGQVNMTVIGALAAEMLSEAIIRAATRATTSGGLPAARDLGTVPERFK